MKAWKAGGMDRMNAWKAGGWMDGWMSKWVDE